MHFVLVDFVKIYVLLKFKFLESVCSIIFFTSSVCFFGFSIAKFEFISFFYYKVRTRHRGCLTIICTPISAILNIEIHWAVIYV